MALDRLLRWAAVFGLTWALASGCGSGDPDAGVPPVATGGQGEGGPPPSTAAGPGSTATPTTGQPPSGNRDQYIVDLAPSSRSPADIEAAQDTVVAALGDHGALVRRLTTTAQMAVSVDDEGRRILEAHPLVRRVQRDVPSAAG